MEVVGVIGLGSMGEGVVANLLRKGWPVRVYDVDEQRVEASLALGAIPGANYQELAQACKKIILLLPMAPWDSTLERVVGDGLLPHLTAGTTLIECGNTSPALCKELAAKVAVKGVGFIDAPISGGPQGAQAGTVTIMAGGSPEAIAACHALFADMGKRVERFGPVGSGQMAKLVNNVLCAANLAVLSEMLVFADRVGLDVQQLVDQIAKSSGGSWVVDHYGRGIVQRVERGSPTPGGGWSGRREGGRDRQLSWALQIADELQVPLPITNVTHSMFLMARGMGKKGLFEPILEWLEDMTGADVRATALKRQEPDGSPPGYAQSGAGRFQEQL